MNKQQEQNNEKKTTSENPVSLKPLSFKDALMGILRVKPKPKDTNKEKDAHKGPRDKPGSA